MLRGRRGRSRKSPATMRVRADVAELVDAHGSGPCGGDPVEVQVLSSASSLLSRAFLPDGLLATTDQRLNGSVSASVRSS
jgi:phosphoribosylcarboxyaminoimidazole (NCAIR) mutase